MCLFHKIGLALWHFGRRQLELIREVVFLEKFSCRDARGFGSWVTVCCSFPCPPSPQPTSLGQSLHFSAFLLCIFTGGAVPLALEENLCKICMDSPIDCVLLECGHMVTCTKCGKRMNECPICRQYVIRAVHVFRS